MVLTSGHIEAARERVAKLDWRHAIEVSPGVVTPRCDVSAAGTLSCWTP
jgi:hypothetical protein